MSRAFITDKEDWIYCAKAGERCMYAEAGKDCRETECEFFRREVKIPAGSGSAVKVVKRKPKENAEATKAGARAGAGAGGNTKAGEKVKDGLGEKAEHPRATKKSKLKKPVKWGGRSGGNLPW